MRGPSPYTISLLRELLRRPSTVRQLAMRTRLPERTIRAQITTLRHAEAITVEDRFTIGRGGAWAVYRPIVQVIC